MKFLKCLLACLALVALLGGICASPARAGDIVQPSNAPVPMALSLVKASGISPPEQAPRRAKLAPTAGCAYNASTAQLLDSFLSSNWLGQVRALSGADPVIIAGETYTITTRYTPRLFDGSPHARAYDYVLDQLQLLHYPAASIEQDAWVSGGFAGMNLVLTIPGQITGTEVVALTAHLDSLSPLATRDTLAPGAEDNASGSAALLEAARLLRYYQFDRTVKLIWFTGEEQGLYGSTSYASDHNLSGYQGVVNLDMFGYDSDNDRCFELHVGTLPASNAVGQCYVESIQAYALGLTSDFITSGATGSSDHGPFWQRGVGAVEVLENYFSNSGLGCNGVSDHNPNYHQVTDTVLNSFPPYNAGQPNTVGADIARAGLAAVAGLAGNRGACFNSAPAVSASTGDRAVHLAWEPLPGQPPELYAAAYKIYRSGPGGSGGIVHFTTATTWVDTQVVAGETYTYQVQALAADGICVSQLSSSLVVTPTAHGLVFLPVVRR
jgi:hypothetical protein